MEFRNPRSKKHPYTINTYIGSKCKIKKKKHMCDAKIRAYGGVDTGLTAAVYGVWYEDDHKKETNAPS